MAEEYIPILFLKIPYGFSILTTTPYPDNKNYLTLFLFKFNPFNATWKITKKKHVQQKDRFLLQLLLWKKPFYAIS